MVFNIEVSIPILSFNNELEQYIIELGNEHHSLSHYSFSEMENNHARNRNHLIYVFIFENRKEIENFIKSIRKMKKFCIECLYEDNISCKLIYASSYYLSTIRKDKVVLYHKRKRSYSEDETILVNEIKCKPNKSCLVQA